MDQAYALLELKAAPSGRRFSGVASTPVPDRTGDVLEPLGATFRNPIPLLWQHDRTRPIGLATLHAPTPGGITFDAVISTVESPGPLKDRTDEASQSIAAGLIRAVSPGFRPLAGGLVVRPDGTRHVTKWEICELSLVTIPANADAQIYLKSLAAARRVEPVMQKTATEHISALENKRAALAARMSEIMLTAAEQEATTDPERAAEHDGLRDQVKSIDADLGRWREHEKLQIGLAAPVAVAPATSTTYPHVSVKSNEEPGIKLARLVIAKMAARYDSCDAATYAERRWGATNEVTLALKAAVAAGTTTDATWAKPLVNSTIVSDFLPLLRAATIVGKIQGLRRVPFNVQVPAQTAGSTVSWVGELKPKPVTSLAFGMETLAHAKIAAIVVLSQELIRFSNPSAEAVVRDDLVAAISAYIDAQFTDPAVAAVAGVNPGSITNGASTAAGTTNPLADILGLINHFAALNLPVNGLTFILSPSNALALSFRTNLDGSPEFPGLSVAGGSYRGLSFITSNTVGTNVIALAPSYILFADDGGVTIDASTEASLQMDSAPTDPPAAATVFSSMFQMNAVALRAERYINWKRIGTTSVKYLTAVAWPSPTGVAEVASGRSRG